MLRNNGETFAWLLGLILLGGFCWLLATLFPTRATLLRILGAAAVAIGAFFCILITARTADDAERPAISASLGSHSELVKATVTAGNLPSDESILIEVNALRKDYGESGPPKPGEEVPFKWRDVTLSQDYAGPDGDGKVNMTLG